jgi:hypothetical protein
MFTKPKLYLLIIVIFKSLTLWIITPSFFINFSRIILYLILVFNILFNFLVPYSLIRMNLRCGLLKIKYLLTSLYIDIDLTLILSGIITIAKWFIFYNILFILILIFNILKPFTNFCNIFCSIICLMLRMII